MCVLLTLKESTAAALQLLGRCLLAKWGFATATSSVRKQALALVDASAAGADADAQGTHANGATAAQLAPVAGGAGRHECLSSLGFRNVHRKINICNILPS
jgi:hypothetical protein